MEIMNFSVVAYHDGVRSSVLCATLEEAQNAVSELRALGYRAAVMRRFAGGWVFA